ncbi:MAG: TolC family protein [Bacteroidota bacterium]|nr:TolC family protein [Bacteroidota bacterium]
MKRILTIVFMVSVSLLYGQGGKAITIDSCYVWARQNYPLLKQYKVIEQTRNFTLENAWRNYIPQLNVMGQATYQSETTNFGDVFGSLPPQFAGLISFPKYSKDQYRLTGEVYQTIFDGGQTKFKKENAQVQASIQEQNLEVNLYALKDRVNQVYFGVLLVDEQLKQNTLQQQDVQNGIDRTQALVNNGTAYKSTIDELKAQLLQVQQTRVEMASSRRSYLMVLALLTRQSLDDSTVLIKPQAPIISTDIKRPEVKMYDLQKKSYDVQSKQLQTGLMPNINAYFDGSYGRPTLNTVSNSFGAFWITGIRFNWSLTSLYTMKNTRRIYGLSQSDLDLQKETFLFNTGINLAQRDQEIKKYSELLERDKEIVDLRTSVKTASNAQLQNGVITGHDYLTQVDAEAQARQAMILHQVQLLQAEYNHQNTSGN